MNQPKILFISYLFEPYPGVGAKRISYWANHIGNEGYEYHVITATAQDRKRDDVTFIAPDATGGWMGFFIKDQGLNWIRPLKDYFESLSEFDYDVVLISGGPFMHFSIGRYLKKKYDIKLILDFRDPFSTNPSFKDNWLKKQSKAYFERRFIRPADALISVNKFCADLIVPNTIPLHIIDNGFNEKEFERELTKKSFEKPVIAHAGTFIKNIRSPENFLKVMQEYFPDDYWFWQFGKDSDYFDPYRNEAFFTYHGMKPYDELIEMLYNAEVCLLVTEGNSFESTTKVFDYIGLNKKILILTKGEPKTGNLHLITKNYPNVVWAKDEPKAIAAAVKGVMRQSTIEFDPYPYSRAASLQKFIALLKSL